MLGQATGRTSKQHHQSRRFTGHLLSFICALACTTVQFTCGAQAQSRTKIEFASLTCISKQKFNDTCSPVQIKAQLYTPAKPTNSLIIVSHGSQGVDERHKTYAEALNAIGISALVIDHWGSRGITNIYSDYQKNWDKGANSFNMAFDALQAIRAVGERGAFTKYGLLGESQGGNAAIWADKLYFYSEYKRVFRSDAPKLNAIVSLYPGCFERSFADTYLPLPFLIVSGEQDDNTPAALCRRYVDWMNSRGGRAQFLSLPNQHHDFDAPYLVRRTSAQNASRCASYLERTTRTWDENGEVFPLTKEGDAAFWKKCFQASANVPMHGGNSGNPTTGFKEWLSFFRANLLD